MSRRALFMIAASVPLVLSCLFHDEDRGRIEIFAQSSLAGLPIENMTVRVIDAAGKKYALDTIHQESPGVRHWWIEQSAPKGQRTFIVQCALSPNARDTISLNLDTVTLDNSWFTYNLVLADTASFPYWMGSGDSIGIRIPLGGYTGNERDTLFGKRHLQTYLQPN